MLTNIQNPKHLNGQGTLIEVTGVHPVYGVIPFAASPTDVEAHGVDIFIRAIAGEFGPIAPYEGLTELAEVKHAKLDQITKDRNTALAQSVTVHGRPWQADAESQRNLSNEILTASAGVFLTPVWRDANNDNMTITDIQQLVDIAAAMKLQTLTAYQTSWARKAAVEAATTVEEVDAV